MNLINFYCFCCSRSPAIKKRKRRTERDEKHFPLFSIFVQREIFSFTELEIFHIFLSLRNVILIFFSENRKSSFMKKHSRALSLSLILIARIYVEPVKLNKHLHNDTSYDRFMLHAIKNNFLSASPHRF